MNVVLFWRQIAFVNIEQGEHTSPSLKSVLLGDACASAMHVIRNTHQQIMFNTHLPSFEFGGCWVGMWFEFLSVAYVGSHFLDNLRVKPIRLISI